MLNTITGANCIQSVFPHCKLQQSEVTKKRLMALNNMENSHDMLHIDQSFKCEYSSNFIWSSAFNVAIYVAVFTTPFEWDNSNFSR